jgi:DNA-binding SARP family transcriptional activator
MEFRVLGSLEVRTDVGPVALGGAKPRGLLAVLLLHANEPVSTERLAVALWGEDAPAVTSLRSSRTAASRGGPRWCGA